MLAVTYDSRLALAASRGARNSAQVLVVNLLAGSTVIGWFVALIMAFNRHRYAPPATVVVQTTVATHGYAPPPAGGQWAPDPTGRHQLRWWDGQGWTDRVSDVIHYQLLQRRMPSVRRHDIL
jgi:hypothetical protein